MQFICGGTFDAGASPDNYKRAEICRQRMGPVFKRIAMNYPPLLFHPINSITAYKGQIIYDTPETEAKAQTPVPYLQWQPAPGVTPPTVGPDGDLSELILPPPAVDGSACAGGPVPPPRRVPRGRLPAGARCAAARRAGGWLMSKLLRDKALGRVRTVALGSGACCCRLLVRRAELAGHAGYRGPRSGSYTITVELPDVATLPQNSPVMVDDVTVGSVSGIDAVQRPDGTFFAAVQLSLDGDVNLPENATARSRRPRCWVLSTSNSPPPADQAVGKLGTVQIPRPHRPLPDHRGGAVRRSASW